MRIIKFFIITLFILCLVSKYVMGEKKPVGLHNDALKMEFTLGTYAFPPRLKNGKVDNRRLIKELHELNANTYHWLVRSPNDDLDAMLKFLPLAKKAKLKVWVTLLPPKESPPIMTSLGFSEPYRLDFDAWAKALAELSLKYDNLVAWSIDDFVHDLDFFTPEYVARFTGTAKKINPGLKFIPCCYYRQTNQAFAEKYGNFLDGILFPYRAESAGVNLQDASKVEFEIKKLRGLFGPDFPVYIDVYATAHSRLGDSTPEYVGEVIESGLKYADGVLIYCHQDPIKYPEKYQVIRESFTRFSNKRK